MLPVPLWPASESQSVVNFRQTMAAELSIKKVPGEQRTFKVQFKVCWGLTEGWQRLWRSQSKLRLLRIFFLFNTLFLLLVPTKAGNCCCLQSVYKNVQLATKEVIPEVTGNIAAGHDTCTDANGCDRFFYSLIFKTGWHFYIERTKNGIDDFARL